MAELEESIYSHSGLSNKKLFLDAQTFIILTTLGRQLWLVHVVTMPFVQQRRAHRTPDRHLDRTQQNKRLNSTPPQNPIKKKVCLLQSHVFSFSAL